MACEEKKVLNQPRGGQTMRHLLKELRKRITPDDTDGEETRAKKICVSAGRIIEIISEVKKGTVGTAPSTPRQAEITKLVTYPSSRFEALPLPVLENIVRRISAADLCTLSQMSKFCCTLFDKDELWKLKAEQEGYCRAKPDENWKFNFKAAANGFLFARTLVDQSPLHYKGDLTVVDPLKIFFTGGNNEMRRAELLQLLYQHRHEDVVVTYRGIDSAFIRSRQDDDTAFEVTRRSKSVIGEDFAESRIIAVIPQKLVKLLMEENDQSQPVGVFVEDVDGEFRSSHDGDFIIRPSNSRCDKSQPHDHDELEDAEVVCISGGSWTFSDDSDDDDEVTEEDLAAGAYEQDETVSWFEYEERYRHGGRGIC
ncbi:hypothetical protein R1flu_024990 [Riccia fluitans]|uniref:F-box domain-containing protein n=1 Tax=Riccia fluitans TaxID=41844 RepID=A0ABD1XWG8_9MARC